MCLLCVIGMRTENFYRAHSNIVFYCSFFVNLRRLTQYGINVTIQKKEVMHMFETFLAEVLKLAPRQMWSVEQIGIYLGEIFTSFSPKKIIASFLAVIELFGVVIFDTPVTPRGQSLDLSGYSLVFEDEFEGDELDMSVWKHRNPGKRRAGYKAESQVAVEDGNLILTAEYLEDGEFGEGWYAADIALIERYKQGYFEIRCKCNDGGGFWSAFWIQAEHPYEAEYSKGGVGGAELDIFEANCWEDPLSRNAVSQTIHCAGVDGVQEGFQSEILGFFKGNDIYNEYNTYGLEWTEDEYIFYVNGVETRRSTFGNGVSQVMEEVIVSLEVPDESKLEGFDKETYSTQFIVDYVKIYQK